MDALPSLVTLGIFFGGTYLGDLDPLGSLAIAFVAGLLTNDLLNRSPF